MDSAPPSRRANFLRALPSAGVATGFVFALVGALIVLLAFPRSRPLFTRLFLRSSTDQALSHARDLSRGLPLPYPDNADMAGLWLSIGSRKAASKTLTTKELDDLITLASQKATEEPDNAYWLQAEAAFLVDAGHIDQARDVWIKASKRLSWNTHETSFLLAPFSQKDFIPADTFAELCALRNQALSSHLESAARSLLSHYWTDPQWGLNVRVATALNGNLIRAHARSLFAMNVGIETVDLSLARRTNEPTHKHHELLVARMDLEKASEKQSLATTDQLKRVFDECDSASALTTREDAATRRDFLSVEAAIIANLPALILCALPLALLIYLSKWLFQGIAWLDARIPWIGSLGVALIALFVTMRVTVNMVSLALALSFVFRKMSPSNTRSAQPDSLGPLHEISMGAIALAMVATLTALLELSLSTNHLRLQAALDQSFDWQSSGIGLLLLLFASVLVTAPLFAFALRHPTPLVLERSLSILARRVALLSLVAAVVAAPVCIIIERSIQPQLQNIFLNEPVYYLSR